MGMKIQKENQAKRAILNRLVKFAIACLFTAGIFVFCYPFAVDAMNNYLDQRRWSHYQEQMKQEEAERLKARLEKENQALKNQSGIPGMENVIDPFEEQTDIGERMGNDYLVEHLIGSIYIPAIQVALPIYDTTNDYLLEEGATLLQGTPYPTGGSGQHSVITGHAGLASKKLFTDLKELQKGDLFYIEIAKEILAYQVTTFRTVLPTDLEALNPVAGEDQVILLTCTPYMINSHRLLVTGKRVPYEKESAKTQIEKLTKHHQLRIWYFVCGGLILLILTIMFCWRQITGRRLRHKKK